MNHIADIPVPSEIYRIFKNMEERALTAETGIADRDNAIAAAVKQEREACAKIAESPRVIHGLNSHEITYSRETAYDIAAAIRARSNGNTEQAQPVRTIKRRGDVNKEAEKAYYSDEPPL